MTRARLAALLLCVMLAGCTRFGARNTLRPLAFDLEHGTSPQSFSHLLSVARELGYSIDFSDAAYGVFGVHTRATMGNGEGGVTLVVQCYRDGHGTVTVSSGLVQSDGSVRVSAQVRRETVAFAQGLAAGRVVP